MISSDELILLTARSTGMDDDDVRRVISALVMETRADLEAGHPVDWPRFGTLDASQNPLQFRPHSALLASGDGKP